MKKSRADYFDMQPVRGSSPTASLAADLSQNFHIDQRYVCPSPFNTNHIADHSKAPSCLPHVVHSFLLRFWEVLLDEVRLIDVAAVD